jgi:hypothetical protein
MTTGRAAAAAVACVLVLGGVPAARAEEPAAPPGRLALVTERVVVFKDGYALVVKGATGTADAEGRVHTEKVPDGAVLGCVWAATGKDHARVLGMRSEWVETREETSTETPTLDVRELLRANVGKAVVLGLVGEKDATVSGTVVEVLERAPDPAPARDPADAARSAWSGPPPPAVLGGTHVVIATSTGRLALPIAEVRTVRSDDLVTRTTRRDVRTGREKRLSFDFGRDSAGKPVGMRLLYFTEGFRWIPTYRLSGALVEDGDLALQGEVLNEAEDVADAEWSLVVGVPNFRFRDVPSPLTLETTLRRTLERADAGLNAQVVLAQNFLANDRMRGGRRGEAGGEPSALDAAPGLAATGEHDLFVYGVGKLSLRKGARAALPLWTARVPVRHLYTWDGTGGLGWRRDATGAPGRGADAASPLRISTNRTWHQLELENAGRVPWTTGPALLLRDDLPLGQDLLTYTPVGGRALLPVTVAVDVRTTYDEAETARTPNAYSWGGHSWSHIEKRGTLTITNYRKEPARLRATLDVVGSAEGASDGGEVAGDSADDVNARSRVVWEATLAPGATVTRTVSLAYYVR